MRGQAHVVLNISPILKPTCMETSLSGIACLLVIRQGGIGGSCFTYPLALSRVLTVAFSLNSDVWNYNWYTQDSKVNITNTYVSNPKGFPYNWLVLGLA
nr:MAG TPA: hypothetical protein [Caudoviricetes sp.]